MKLLRALLLIIFPMVCFSQSESDNYLKAIEAYKLYYNSHSYDSLYNMFAQEMQKAISLEVLKQQMDGLHQQIGAVGDISFIEDVNGVKIYKVNHESMVMEYSIVLNSNNQITGLRPQQYRDRSIKVIERNTTKMILPFKEEWFVFWGGTEVTQNYHVAYPNQKYAYDIMMVKDGKSYKGDPKKNESYYVFGKEIIAPCEAKVVKVITGVHDNIPGELNPQQLTGNTVVLETQNKEYLLFAHLKLGSVNVEEGQMVKQGDLLGQCGNSGNTTEAHLHLSLQNTIEMSEATGGKLFFDKILVNGEIKEDYLPVKNDKIQNIKL
ncbi:MAG: peptidoglycan DD-metalloendopeptidase family protein [Flavobacteriaceae bacterium]